jgi:hypothetical protein
MRDLYLIFIKPTEYFLKLKENPSWILSLSIVIVLIIIASAISYPVINEFKINMLKEKIDDEEQIKIIENRLEGKFNYFLSIVQFVVSAVVGILLQALIIYILALILGGTINYKMSFSLITNASLIMASGAVITSLFIYFKGSIYAGLNAGVFIENTNSFLHRFLTSVELFNIWFVYIIGLGASIMADLKKNTTITLLFVLWIIWITIISIIQGIFL